MIEAREYKEKETKTIVPRQKQKKNTEEREAIQVYNNRVRERERPEIHESQFSTPGSDLNGKIISGWEKDTALTARRVHVVVSISPRRKTYIPIFFPFHFFLTLPWRKG